MKLCSSVAAASWDPFSRASPAAPPREPRITAPATCPGDCGLAHQAPTGKVPSSNPSED